MVKGRKKFSTRCKVFAGEELFAAPSRNSASVMTLAPTSDLLFERSTLSTFSSCFSA
jgi:hypothetical protein